MNKNPFSKFNHNSGIVNQTNNFIGIRLIDDESNSIIELIDIGEFFSFSENLNFRIEISHSQNLKFIHKILSPLIYHYKEAGKLCFYQNHKIQFLPQEEKYFLHEDKAFNYSTLENKRKKNEIKNLLFGKR